MHHHQISERCYTGMHDPCMQGQVADLVAQLTDKLDYTFIDLPELVSASDSGEQQNIL